MVTEYTASEKGDVIIAKLIEPYSGVNSILDWDIHAGFSNEFTVGKLTFTQGDVLVSGIGTNLDLNNGDIILAGGYEFIVDSTPSNTQVILQIPAQVSLVNVDFYIKTDQWNYFEYEYRWSQNDKINGGEFSEFHPLNKGTLLGDILSLNIDSNSPLWIEIKASVIDLQPLHTISFLKVTFTLEYENGIIEECPQICAECDPYDLEGCANIIIDCESENLYNPYALQKPSHLYKSLSSLASKIAGHNVTYYRVEPNVRSKDVILKEYSLYDVIDKQSVKVLVPDNEFPTEQSSFNIFGMGFEDFEIHIIGDEFRKVFGENKSPRSRDYLYFPFNNKMYEVNSVALADEFNRELTYFKVMLKKFENRTSTNKEGFEEDLTDLVQGVEEIFGEEIKEEFNKVTKPLQYQSTHHRSQDGIRKFVHKDLEIKDIDLMNKWTVITRNYYNMSTILSDEFQAPGVIYEQNSNLKINNNLAISFWFNPTLGFKTLTGDLNDIIDGTSVLDKGLMLQLSGTHIRVIINAQEYLFPHGIIFSSETWYGLVFNLSNTYNEVSVKIYKLDEQLKYTEPTSNTKLKEMYDGKLDTLSPLVWETDVDWSLRGSNLNIACVRLFNKVIEEEQHTNILHQYVVRDSQHSIIIDNAIPSLQLQKYSESR